MIKSLLGQYKAVADFYMEVPNEDGGANSLVRLDEHCSEVFEAYNRLAS